MSVIKGVLIAVGSIVGLIIALIVSVSMGLFSPWKENTQFPSADMPWNGPDSRPVEEIKKVPAFTTTGYDNRHRWYTSFGHKPEPNYYGRVIDKVVGQFEELEDWPTGGSAWYGGDIIHYRRAPFTFTFMTIQPLVVFMAPGDSILPGTPEDRRFVSSQVVTNNYYYGTSLPNHPETVWFSPELNQPRKLLDLKPGETKTIDLGKGRLILKEENGMIVSRRE